MKKENKTYDAFTLKHEGAYEVAIVHSAIAMNLFEKLQKVKGTQTKLLLTEVENQVLVDALSDHLDTLTRRADYGIRELQHKIQEEEMKKVEKTLKETAESVRKANSEVIEATNTVKALRNEIADLRRSRHEENK